MRKQIACGQRGVVKVIERTPKARQGLRYYLRTRCARSVREEGLCFAVVYKLF